MDEPETPTIPLETLDKLSGLLPANAWTSTVPIMILHGETLRQHGTGTLLRIADAFFLVTAAHVLTEAANHNAKITVGAAGHIHPLQIAGQAHVAADDSLDVAIWRLSNDSVKFLSNNTFLHLSDIFPPDEFDDDFYFVCGFPTESSTTATQPDDVAQIAPLQFCTYKYEGDGGNLEGYNAEYHVLLNANRQYLTRGSGAARDFPNKVFGLSGCPIWKARAMGVPQDQWKPGQAKLVAVQTSAYPKEPMHKILKGTTWKAVSSLIAEVYSDLKPSFGIYYK